MAYSKEKKEDCFDRIILEIENGKSLRATLSEENMPSNETFYKWLEEDELKAKRYARASELRADRIFEEILEISEHTEEDHTPFTGSNVIQRDRLRIDARKWMLSKMAPKKYGDKLDMDVTTGGEKINSKLDVSKLSTDVLKALADAEINDEDDE